VQVIEVADRLMVESVRQDVFAKWMAWMSATAVGRPVPLIVSTLVVSSNAN